jgi:MFS superfamily sulfate permease-like transporter
MLLVAWVLRLGFVANFISEPVLVGFKAGIGLVIVLDQVPKLLGIHFAKGAFLHNLLAIAQASPETQIPTLIIGSQRSSFWSRWNTLSLKCQHRWS